jgi:hypothetical protein
MMLLAATSSTFSFSFLSLPPSDASLAADQVTGSSSSVPSPAITGSSQLKFHPFTHDRVAAKYYTAPQSAATTTITSTATSTVTSVVTPPPTTLPHALIMKPSKHWGCIMIIVLCIGLIIILLALLCMTKKPGKSAPENMPAKAYRKNPNKSPNNRPTDDTNTDPARSKLIDDQRAAIVRYMGEDARRKHSQLIFSGHYPDFSADGLTKKDLIELVVEMEGKINAMKDENTLQAVELAELRRPSRDSRNSSRDSHNSRHDSVMEDATSHELKNQLAQKEFVHQTQIERIQREHQTQVKSLRDLNYAQFSELAFSQHRISEVESNNAELTKGANQLFYQVAQIIIALIHVDLTLGYRLVPTLKDLLPSIPLDSYVPAPIDSNTQFPQFKFVLHTFLPDYSYRCPCGGSSEASVERLRNNLAEIYTGPNHIPTNLSVHGTNVDNPTVNTSSGAGVNPLGQSVFPPFEYKPPQFSTGLYTRSSESTFGRPSVNTGSSAGDYYPGKQFGFPLDTNTGSQSSTATSTGTNRSMMGTHTVTGALAKPKPSDSAATSVLTDPAPAPNFGAGNIFGHLAEAPALSSDAHPTSGSMFPKQQQVNPSGTPSVPPFGQGASPRGGKN